MNKFFHGINTLEELKKAYRKMALIHHPDRGGNEKDFIALKDEFDRLSKILLHKQSKEKRTWTNEKTGEQKEYTQRTATAEEMEQFKKIIDAVIFFDGVDIEIIGTWIWLTGNTKAYKEKLKELTFRWSKPKNAWYWHEGEYKKKYGKNHTLEEIRNMHDSRTVKKGTKKPQLTE